MRLIDAEKLLEFGLKFSHGFDHDGVLLVPYREVTRAISSAPTVELPRWFPMSQSPKFSERFFVAVLEPSGFRYTMQADYNRNANLWVVQPYLGSETRLTHWMPLPEPPKED